MRFKTIAIAKSFLEENGSHLLYSALVTYT